MPRLVAGWRDLMRASDEKLTTTLNLMPAAPGRPGSITLTCCYASPDGGEAAEALRPFRALAPVTSDGIRVMPYAEVLEDMTPLPPGLRMEVRTAFFTALDDARVSRRDLFTGGGAACAAAWAARPRSAGRHRLRPPGRRCHARGRLLPQPAPPGLLHQALDRWSPVAALGSCHVGFLGSADPDVAAAYPRTPTGARRGQVRYDFGNVFRRTHNISPAAPSDRCHRPPFPHQGARRTRSSAARRRERSGGRARSTANAPV